MTVGKPVMLVLEWSEWGLGWGEADGCTGMLVQMNTDDDKVHMKIAQTKKNKLTGWGGEQYDGWL